MEAGDLVHDLLPGGQWISHTSTQRIAQATGMLILAVADVATALAHGKLVNGD